MRFRKNVPSEKRNLLTEQLRQYKNEMSMTVEELHELESWVAGGNSPYDNGDYIYADNGCPMDFISAHRVLEEEISRLMELTQDEQKKELHDLHGAYDTVKDDIVICNRQSDFQLDPDEELPFD